MIDLIREYNAGMAKLKQYAPESDENEGFDYKILMNCLKNRNNSRTGEKADNCSHK